MAGGERVLESIRAEAAGAPSSGIIEVMRHGFGRPGIVPLWAGEGDLPTSPFICEAASRSLAEGETFYTHQTGIPDLRDALARYHTAVYGGVFGRPFEPDRFFVTGSGMHAIELAITAVAGPGDEVLVPTPAWPNFAAAVGIRGARAVEVPKDFTTAGWVLDVDRLAAAVTPATRAIFINSPSNPTGWTASEETLAAVLALARRHGLWIIADEVYGRFHYAGAGPAPSFHALITEDDRVIFVNTFSKNWAMTGWRIGWLEAPPSLTEVIINLVQYSSSGTAVFMQRAAIAALQGGEDFLALQVDRCRKGLAVLRDALVPTGRVRFAEPAGAFYLFFAIDGEADTRRLGLRLVDEANVGIAPGDTFGRAGKGWMRLCFARSPERLEIAAYRLKEWLEKPNPVI